MMTATLQLLQLGPSRHSPRFLQLPLDLEVIIDLESIIHSMELDVLFSPLVYSSATESVNVLSGMHIYRQHLMYFSINRLDTLLFSQERQLVGLGILLSDSILLRY